MPEQACHKFHKQLIPQTQQLYRPVQQLYNTALPIVFIIMPAFVVRGIIEDFGT